MNVQQPTSQVCKPGESLALRKVKTPHNGKTSVSRFPLTKQDILLQFSGCFEGIGRFPGDPHKFHLKPDHQPARHAPKKQGISEEVNEHTDWVHSNIFVEKALEREPYYTHSTGEITKEFPNRERVEHAGHFPTPMEMCMATTPLRPQREPNDSIFKTKPLSSAVQHTALYQTLLSDMQNSHQAWKVHQIS